MKNSRSAQVYPPFCFSTSQVSQPARKQQGGGGKGGKKKGKKRKKRWSRGEDNTGSCTAYAYWWGNKSSCSLIWAASEAFREWWLEQIRARSLGERQLQKKSPHDWVWNKQPKQSVRLQPAWLRAAAGEHQGDGGCAMHGTFLVGQFLLDWKTLLVRQDNPCTRSSIK